MGPGRPRSAYRPPVGQEPAKSCNGPAPQATRPTKALLIGINYEGTRAQLRGCQNDALDMLECLTRQYGFSPQNVRVMIDRQGGNYESPTRANIMQGLRWLVQGVQPGDCLFFHYSGHGAQQEDPSCSEEDCMDETILPLDFQQAGEIVDDELFETMVRPLPSGAKLTAVMDCCHSGTGLDLPYTLQASGGGGFFSSARSTCHWTCDDNPCHSEGHVINLSGCCDDQTSADIQSMYNKPRGAMTEAFIETLKAKHYDCVSYAQLLSGIRQHLSRGGHSQYPMLTSSQMFDLNQNFDIVGGICPNMNPVVGRQFNKRKHPKRDWLGDGDPLGDMLLGMAGGELLGMGLGMGMGGMGMGMDPGFGGGYYGGGGDMFGGGGGGLLDFGGGGSFGGDGDWGGGDDW